MEKGMIKIKMNVDVLRNPQTNALMHKDKEYVVPENQYWLRRLNDKDCEKVHETKVQPKTESKKQTKKTSKKSKSVAEPLSEPDLDSQQEGNK